MDYYSIFLQEQRANKLKHAHELDQEARPAGTSFPTEEDCEHSEGIDLTRITTPLDENAPF